MKLPGQFSPTPPLEFETSSTDEWIDVILPSDGIHANSEHLKPKTFQPQVGCILSKGGTKVAEEASALPLPQPMG